MRKYAQLWFVSCCCLRTEPNWTRTELNWTEQTQSRAQLRFGINALSITIFISISIARPLPTQLAFWLRVEGTKISNQNQIAWNQKFTTTLCCSCPMYYSLLLPMPLRLPLLLLLPFCLLFATLACGRCPAPLPAFSFNSHYLTCAAHQSAASRCNLKSFLMPYNECRSPESRHSKKCRTAQTSLPTLRWALIPTSAFTARMPIIMRSRAIAKPDYIYLRA